MTQQHPNVQTMLRLDLRNIAACVDFFAPDVVMHYFNPKLPDLQGDYAGIDGIARFFARIGGKSAGTFRVEPVSVSAKGDELVVAHTRNTMTLDGEQITIDAVTVWRFVDGKIAEMWDIPAVFTEASAG